MGTKRIITGPRKGSLPLDIISGKAIAAYGLRQLSSAYNGPAISVARSSDFAQLSIGFVNGVLDTATMLAFVGNGNVGYIYRWFDQSGNNNYIDAVKVAAPQPNFCHICDLGVVFTVNGKPSANMINGSDGYFGQSTLVSGTLPAYPQTQLFVSVSGQYPNGANGFRQQSSRLTTTQTGVSLGYGNGANISSYEMDIDAASLVASFPAVTENVLQFAGGAWDGASYDLYNANNVISGAHDFTTLTSNGGYCFGLFIPAAIRGFNNGMSEIYHFNSKLSQSDVVALRNNCNVYFGL